MSRYTDTNPSTLITLSPPQPAVLPVLPQIDWAQIGQRAPTHLHMKEPQPVERCDPSRCAAAGYHDCKVYIYSQEDLILYKLIYFGLNQQSKHSRDIAAILKSKKNELDMNYIEQWATRLELSSPWKEMLDNVS